MLMIHLESRSIKQFREVKMSHQVLEIINSLYGNVKDIEIGHRGYFLTGDIDYLEPYFNGVASLSSAMDKLSDSDILNPTQVNELEQLEELLNEKYIEIYESIERYRQGVLNQDTLINSVSVSKELSKQVNLKIQKLKSLAEEDADLRDKRYVSLLEQIKYIFIVESVLFLIVILVLTWLVNIYWLKPIARLNYAVDHFDLNNVFHPVRVFRNDELGQLTKAFNYMGAAVSKVAKDLKSDISAANEQKREAIVQSSIDPLTGLFNRRYMEIEAEKLLASCERYHESLCCLMIDIDHFKLFNDKHGHILGDLVLKEVGSKLKNSTRNSDLAVRYGGEEFALILSHMKLDEGMLKAEEIRSDIASLNLTEINGEQITVSIGVTENVAGERDLMAIISRADSALYRAKKSGRNRVESEV